MAENTMGKCCGSCKHFFDEHATGDGFCHADVPFFVHQHAVLFNVECTEGDDCNAWQGKEDDLDAKILQTIQRGW